MNSLAHVEARYIADKYISFRLLVIICLIFFFAQEIQAKEEQERKHPEQDWGLAVGIRSGGIPFAADEGSVYSFIPMIYYEDEHFFLNGLEGGVKVVEKNNWHINGLFRMRFFDIPKRFQNVIQEDSVDFGLQLHYQPSDFFFMDMEAMTEQDFRSHANVRSGLKRSSEDFEWKLYGNLRYKTSSFNSYYYGLTVEDVGSGVDASLGLEVRYHLFRNLYLLGSAQTTLLDSNVRDVSFVDKDHVEEYYLGLGFFNDRKKEHKKELSINPYWRLAHGWGTPSNIGDIFAGDMVKDPYNNQLTSIFYGHPLTDELFGIPFEIYLTPGFVHHWSSEVQSSGQEYVLAIKAYYTVNWPTKWRVGVAEGLSYASPVTYIEQSEMGRKGYESSKLLNYLDFSLDIDMGDLLNVRSLDGIWLGYTLHHRSAIFESASHFGRIKGGSNYNAIYLQYHF
jgi:MipA family protein